LVGEFAHDEAVGGSPGTQDAHAVTSNQSVAIVFAAHAKLGEKISLVDMHPVLGASDYHNKLHPNDTGYARMANV
jgi:hypothetical protein